jgi:hypothetical protein
MPPPLSPSPPLQRFTGHDGSYNGRRQPFRCAPLAAWDKGDAVVRGGGRRNIPVAPLIASFADAHLRTWNASVPLWDSHKPGGWARGMVDRWMGREGSLSGGVHNRHAAADSIGSREAPLAPLTPPALCRLQGSAHTGAAPAPVSGLGWAGCMQRAGAFALLAQRAPCRQLIPRSPPPRLPLVQTTSGCICSTTCCETAGWAGRRRCPTEWPLARSSDANCVLFPSALCRIATLTFHSSLHRLPPVNCIPLVHPYCGSRNRVAEEGKAALVWISAWENKLDESRELGDEQRAVERVEERCQ